MPRNQLVTRFAVGLAALVVLSACASLGTPDDQAMARSLWADEMRGEFTSWAQFEDFEGIQQGFSEVHSNYVAVWLNDVAAGDPASLPPGSLLVKENFVDEGRDSLESITVMKRVEGYDPEHGDWFWARYTPRGELTDAGKVGLCIDCHSEERDYSFLN